MAADPPSETTADGDHDEVETPPDAVSDDIEAPTETAALSPVPGEINPARVLAALGAIGYTPDSAICDIVDNSVSHGRAENVWIELVTQPGMAESRRNSALHYIIADDGVGMDA